MKIKHILMGIVAAAAAMPVAVAQESMNALTFDLGQVGINSYLESAVKPAIVLVTQDYVLKEKASGKKFGANGRSNFGSATAVGVLSEGRLIFPSSVLTPWVDDSNFKKLKNADRYEPVLRDNGAMVTPIDTAMCGAVKEAVVLNLDNRAEFEGTSWCQSDSVGNGVTGLANTPYSPESRIWIIWVQHKDGKALTADSKLTYTVSNRTVDINGDEPAELDATGVLAPVCALVVKPKVSGIGMLTFELAGMASENGGKWIVERLGNPVKVTDEVTEAVSEETDEVAITPLDNNSDEPKGKKKKK